MRILLLLIVLPLWTSAQQDSIQRLTFADFMERVVIHHPVSQQADLRPARGDAAVLAARGAFDPKAKADLYQKYFDDKQYYSLANAGLQIPTWFGLSFKGGFEQNRGSFLNPENTLPVAGLWYAGVTVPIGQGLFIDERRAVLKQARIYREATEQERRIMLNDLLFAAAAAYWDWYKAFNDLLILEEAVDAAFTQFEAVKRSAELGDIPSIDTLEAGIQWQNLQVAARSASIELFKARMELSTYLWEDGSIPLEINESVSPPTALFTPEMELSIEFPDNPAQSLVSHPELLMYNLKLDELDVERRWKTEQLKPRLDLSYNPISEPVGGDPLAGFSPDNYTWGVSFSMPLLLRKERGGLQMTDIKIDNTLLEQQQKVLQLNNKAFAFQNELALSTSQIEQFEQVTDDYFRLWQAEIVLFEIGESSLFLINTRQQRYITARQKLNEIKAKNRMAEAGLTWSQALFPDWADSLRAE